MPLHHGHWFAIFQVSSAVLLGFFEASDYMLQIGVPALRIISISFLLAGFCIISSSTFQALGHGVLSLIVSLVRQLVCCCGGVAAVFERTAGTGLVGVPLCGVVLPYSLYFLPSVCLPA